MKDKKTIEIDPEIDAISTVFSALKGLDAGAQLRVLEYVAGKLDISLARSSGTHIDVVPQQTETEPSADTYASKEDSEDNQFEQISPIARKWMKRTSLNPVILSTVFSLGSDEIDLIAKTIPGRAKKERMHNVFLLKGVAAYLATGAARFTYEEVKEACLHYDAFDAGNFSAYVKSLAADISGGKETGYSLSPRGLTNATELLKTMTTGSQSR